MNDNIPAPLIDYTGMLRRRRAFFCLVAVVGICLAVAVALLLPSVYKSTSTILIEEQEIPSDLVMSTVTSYAEQRLETIKQRIMSTSRLLEIANKYNLYAEKRDRWTIEEIVEQMRKDIMLDYISADVMDRRTGKPSSVTIAFTLSYEGTESPGTVRDVAQVLASLFLEENIKVRERQVSEASTFFEDEMKRVKDDLDALDPRITKFKNEHLEELPDMLPVNRQGLNDVERKLDQIVVQKRSLMERRASLQSLMAETPKYKGTEENEKKRLEEMKSQLAILAAKYSDNYPDVIKLRGAVEEMKKRLQTTEQTEQKTPDNPVYINLTSEMSGLDDQIRSLEKQGVELETSAALFKRHITATPTVEGEYRELMGERESLEHKYLDLTAKYMEARVAQGLEKDQKGERFTIIDPAALPEEPYKPNRLAIVVLGTLVSIVVSAGFTLLREFMDRAVHTPEALLTALQLPLLTIVPQIVTRDERRTMRRRRMIITTATLSGVVAVVTTVHLFYMDLNVVLAKLMHHVSL